MRSSRRGADDTWRHRLAAVEQFDLNPLRRNAQRCERVFHVRHEASRAAEVDIGFPWDTDRLEHRSRQVAGHVEIVSGPVARARAAVADIAVAAREREHQPLDLGGKWMVLSIACPVQPEHLPRRALHRQRVQHGQDGRRSDSRAEQHHRPLTGLQNETPAWRTDVENSADPDMLPQIGSSGPIPLDLHADSIALRRLRT